MQLTIQIISYCRLKPRADRIFQGALDEMLPNPTLAKLNEKSSSTNSDNIDDLFNQKDGEIARRYLRERLAP